MGFYCPLTENQVEIHLLSRSSTKPYRNLHPPVASRSLSCLGCLPRGGGKLGGFVPCRALRKGRGGPNFCVFFLLSGPLNRLNAILSLLHPLDRHRTPSAIGSAIGRPISRPISHPNTGGSPQPPLSKPLGRLNRAIVAL